MPSAVAQVAPHVPSRGVAFRYEGREFFAGDPVRILPFGMTITSGTLIGLSRSTPE